MRPNTEATFWARFAAEGECLLWQGVVNKDGYGLFWLQGRAYLAHRLAWKFRHGAFPDQGRIIRHTCHNRLCGNPGHLVEGTQRDNIRDCIEAGRRNNPKADQHWTHRRPEHVKRFASDHRRKLTSEQVLNIRARSTQTTATLAHEFGVSPVTISSILNRKTWKHL